MISSFPDSADRFNSNLDNNQTDFEKKSEVNLEQCYQVFTFLSSLDQPCSLVELFECLKAQEQFKGFDLSNILSYLFTRSLLQPAGVGNSFKYVCNKELLRLNQSEIDTNDHFDGLGNDHDFDPNKEDFVDLKRFRNFLKFVYRFYSLTGVNLRYSVSELEHSLTPSYAFISHIKEQKLSSDPNNSVFSLKLTNEIDSVLKSQKNHTSEYILGYPIYVFEGSDKVEREVSSYVPVFYYVLTKQQFSACSDSFKLDPTAMTLLKQQWSGPYINQKFFELIKKNQALKNRAGFSFERAKEALEQGFLAENSQSKNFLFKVCHLLRRCYPEVGIKEALGDLGSLSTDLSLRKCHHQFVNAALISRVTPSLFEGKTILELYDIAYKASDEQICASALRYFFVDENRKKQQAKLQELQAQKAQFKPGFSDHSLKVLKDDLQFDISSLANGQALSSLSSENLKEAKGSKLSDLKSLAKAKFEGSTNQLDNYLALERSLQQQNFTQLLEKDKSNAFTKRSSIVLALPGTENYEEDPSQNLAVRALLNNPLTILQGPPGTGKTSVITVAAYNQLLRDRTCLITSYNNAAVDAFLDKASFKLHNEDLHFAKYLKSDCAKNSLALKIKDLSKDLLNRATFPMGLSFDKLSEYAQTLSNLEDQRYLLYSLVSICDKTINNLQSKVEIACNHLINNFAHLPILWSFFFDIFGQAQADIEQKENLLINKLNVKKLKLYQQAFDSLAGEVNLSLLSVHLKKTLLKFNLLGIKDKVYLLKSVDPNIFGKFIELILDLQKALEAIDFIKQELIKEQLLVSSSNSLEQSKRQDKDFLYLNSVLEIDFDQINQKLEELNQAPKSNNLNALLCALFNTNPDKCLIDSLDQRALFGANSKNLLDDCDKLAFKYHPIVTTSLLSMGASMPCKAAMFDLVIIDEAAQCLMYSIIPVLFRAKRVAFVGDPQQLKALFAPSIKQIEHVLRALDFTYDDCPAHYISYSAYDFGLYCNRVNQEQALYFGTNQDKKALNLQDVDLVDHAQNTNQASINKTESSSSDFDLMFKVQNAEQNVYGSDKLQSLAQAVGIIKPEHFTPANLMAQSDHFYPLILANNRRSHSQIVSYISKEFYHNQLGSKRQINLFHLQQVGRLIESIPLGMHFINVENEQIEHYASSRRSHESAQAIVHFLEHIVANGYQGSIGVINAYRLQKSLIQELCLHSPVLRHLSNDRLEVDTVHRFQGKERDLIILSLCLNYKSSLFINYNLINVAVSRARDYCFIFGNKDVASSAMQSPCIRELTKYLPQEQRENYADQSNYVALLEPNQKASFDTDYEKLLYDCIKKELDQESALFNYPKHIYAQLPILNYRLDLALIYKNIGLDIECDGSQHYVYYNNAQDYELISSDLKRAEDLKAFGISFQTIRFKNTLISKDPVSCAKQVVQKYLQMIINHKER